MPSKHPTWKNNPEFARGRAQPAVQDDLIYLLDHQWPISRIAAAAGVCERQIYFVIQGVKRVRTGTAEKIHAARLEAERDAGVGSLIDYLTGVE